MKAMVPAVLVALVLMLSPAARGDDAFYRVPLPDLLLTQGALPKDDSTAPRRWEMYAVLRPYAALDTAGEAYLTTSADGTDGRGGWAGRWSTATGVLVIRAEAGAPVTGSIFLPSSDWSGMVPLRFSIPAASASPEARRAFYTAKEEHFDRLQATGAPGSAWFRRQATEAHRARGVQEPATPAVPTRPQRDISGTYDLFVGGRALSENLQLARDLPAASRSSEPEEKPVPISDIEGITVASMDWAAGASKPALDALAAAIPADQHAVFFRSFDALMAMADETNERGLPVFRSVGERSEDARVVERYERQLCLHPGAVARLLGPKVITSVAITGSDPYFPTGTDVAVLFQGADAGGLRELFANQIRTDAAGTKAADGNIDGVAYTGFASDDRAICSYLAVIGKAVVVTNSTEQIRRLAAVQAGKFPAIASLPEYLFFRSRYPVAAEGETGFLFLSDATIRRWCGPQWRIGASRRLRAGAIMADVQAFHMDEVVAGVHEERLAESDTPMRTIGKLSVGPGGVRSSVYGSLEFMTPIAELGIKEAASDEAASYKRWRDTYQRNWSWAFDPIAASFGIAKERLSADLTVMPLIVASQYRTWLDAARGAVIAPDAGDPHDAIAHGVFAINVNSPAVKQTAGMAQMFVPGVEIDPLGWLGQSVAVYADPDPFWARMLAAPDDGKFFEENAASLPVAVYAEVGSALKLTAFLSAARGAIEQAAPGMAAWETRDYNGQPYVRVGLTEKAKAETGGGEFDKLGVFYAATPRALIISLSEEMLKRAIDRRTERTRAAAGDATAGTAPQHPWLGSSLCLRFTRQGLELVGGPGGSNLRQASQQRSWSNIPILNEWKRRYPDKDPVEVHAAQWGTRLVCPGGGQYRWNDRFKTMESTVYGHPGEPKPGPDGLGPLETIRGGDFGLTFEDNGLRARAVLERGPAKP